ncbi:MAG: hypothetical protein HC871_17575 [Rhizobiales bacterium]|nr:hypothetical protein [Hyphomicrobiales bacterium]
MADLTLTEDQLLVQRTAREFLAGRAGEDVWKEISELGWQALPGVLLSAALAALTVALARSAIGGRVQAADEIAFGPYLALALWAGWLLGPITFW